MESETRAKFRMPGPSRSQDMVTTSPAMSGDKTRNKCPSTLCQRPGENQQKKKESVPFPGPELNQGQEELTRNGPCIFRDAHCTVLTASYPPFDGLQTWHSGDMFYPLTDTCCITLLGSQRVWTAVLAAVLATWGARTCGLLKALGYILDRYYTIPAT
jgi:hypothetical protein